MDRQWFLESISTDGTHVNHPITRLPFTIGREAGNDLVLNIVGLSRQHVRLSSDISGCLRLTDLNSTNGSFVNRHRVEGSSLLKENDILHLATAEFRLRLRQSEQMRRLISNAAHTQLMPDGLELSEQFVAHESEFLDLLDGHGVSGAAQPIVDIATRQVFAYELLGRAIHPLLPTSPGRLFELAGSLDREVQLSEAFRKFGIAALAPRLSGFPLFINTHPKETFAESFFDSLASLRQQMPRLDLVIEIHETAVTESDRLAALAARFRSIGVRFAYDDFGAGQSRLNELGDAPPHFVKFDMGLIHNLHLASERKQRVVREMVRLVRDLGAIPLAEGVELEAEARICAEMGFALVQGYLTGRPIPVEQLA